MKDGSRVKNRLTGKGQCIPHLRSMTSKALSFEEQNPETACPSHLRPLGSWPGVPPLPHTETAPPGRLGMSPTGQESSAKLCAWALLPVQGKHINTSFFCRYPPYFPLPRKRPRLSLSTKASPLATPKKHLCPHLLSYSVTQRVLLEGWTK